MLKEDRQSTLLPLGILLLGIITSYGTVQTEPAESKPSNQKSPSNSAIGDVATANFVGGWVNEGELCSFKRDGTYSLRDLDPEKPVGATETTVAGTWKQKGKVLTVAFDMEWGGGRVSQSKGLRPCLTPTAMTEDTPALPSAATTHSACSTT